jgi:YVTN family beta-propeller protein
MYKKIIHAVLSTTLFALSSSILAGDISEKIYVALEGDGTIAVLDAQTRQIIKQIVLTETVDGSPVVFAPHNVQVAPNGKTVWVTANVQGDHHEHEPAGHEAVDAVAADQVIVIDPETDNITQRIPIAAKVHLSHVVVSNDGRMAYVNAQKQQRIYKIDAATYRVRGFTKVADQGPHGLRLSTDSSKAYVAMMHGKNLGILDTTTGGIRYVSLGGAAVQTGVTPDGKMALASLYDVKRVAVYQIETGQLGFVNLPSEARGPLQLYPSPDSRFVYVADQGHSLGKPVGEYVYKIDLATKQVVASIKVGKAPHGAVVSKDGRLVYATNLLSGDLSVIDTTSDQEVARIPVGKEPNGISLWSPQVGGTP